MTWYVVFCESCTPTDLRLLGGSVGVGKYGRDVVGVQNRPLPCAWFLLPQVSQVPADANVIPSPASQRHTTALRSAPLMPRKHTLTTHHWLAHACKERANDTTTIQQVRVWSLKKTFKYNVE